jgi:hypothetical protein
LIAGAWLARQVWLQSDSLGATAAELDYTRLAIGLIPAVVNRCLQAGIFYLVLRRVAGALPSVGPFLVHYFASQIVRYLPGKIWSIVYQADRWSSHVNRSHVWEANLELSVVMTVNSLLVATAVWLAYTGHAMAAGVTLVIATVLTFAILHLALFRRLLVQPIVKLLGRENDVSERRAAGALNGLITALIQVDWVVYFVVWYFLMPRSYAVGDMIVIATAYAVAWLIGFLALVLPDGWIVREAAFVWAGTWLGFGTAELIVICIVARLFYIAADVLGCGMVALAGMAAKTTGGDAV